MVNSVHDTFQYVESDLARNNEQTLTTFIEKGNPVTNPYHRTKPQPQTNSFSIFPYVLYVQKYGTNNQWAVEGQYTLPIPPQAMVVRMPFAHTVIPTLNGVYEEANGAPFRDIQLSGTFGVWASRGKYELGIFEKASIQTAALLTATISAANNTSLLGSIFRTADQRGLTTALSETNRLTGYYQFQTLRAFLETFAFVRKNSKFYRMVFSNYKTGEHYVVVPREFDVRREAGSPHEFLYTLAFRAYRSVEDPNQNISLNAISTHGTTFFAAALLASLTAVQLGVASVGALASGLAADIGALANLANGVLGSFQGLDNISTAWGSIGPSWTRLFNSFKDTRDTNTNDAETAITAAAVGGLSFYPVSPSIYPALQTTKILTPVEAEAEFAVNRAAILFDTLEADRIRYFLQNNANAINQSMDFVSNLARNSDMTFIVPNSKFAIQLPYNTTLEALALQYLGDAERWIEIATLNGLQEPYIDEVGTKLPIITNPTIDAVTVEQHPDLKTTGTIGLVSDSNPITYRRILAMQPFGEYVTLSLDGSDVSAYTVARRAYVRVYKQNTIRSGQLLFIPSSTEADQGPFNFVEALVGPTADSFIRVAGIDIKLRPNTQSNLIGSQDILITPEGNAAYTFGTDNLIQSVLILLSTPQGSLKYTPNFGAAFADQVGQALTTQSELEQLKTQLDATIMRDPSFTGTEYVNVTRNGPNLVLNFGLKVRGTSKFIPVSVTLSNR